MADEHRFSADVDTAGGPVERKSGWKSCLTGCLIVCVILAVIAILIGVWIRSNWRDIASSFGTTVMAEVINSAQLPQGEKQQIMVEVERVAQAIRENTISGKQFEILVNQLTVSPAISLIVAATMEQDYFSKSGLTAEEKAQGVQTLRRFIRGALDDKINRPGVDAAMVHIANRDQNGLWNLRKTLTDDELKAFLAEAKKQADEAGIPEQATAVDPSDEVKKIVDEALNAPTPPESEPAAAPSPD
jgi:hypothetical protein